MKLKEKVSIIIPTYNEKENILKLIHSLLSLSNIYDIEILIVDDDSKDGTTEAVRLVAQQDRQIRLIHRLDRKGLSSAIKEGLINATGDILIVMDGDGQHQVEDIPAALSKIIGNDLDVVIGSRFMKDSAIYGLSKRRKKGSNLANRFARTSLSRNYRHITDYMSGFILLKRDICIPYIMKVDVNGFKFLYELLSISLGILRIGEIGITFQPRIYGSSKLDVAILWDFLISLLHSLSFRILPRRAISFAIVGFTGVFVQLSTTVILTDLFKVNFLNALPFSVIIAATSNYIINNALTFRANRLKDWMLVKGLLKFLLVSSLPILANVGLASSVYNILDLNTFWSQIAGVLLVFIWNYVASSRFVWNTPT